MKKRRLIRNISLKTTFLSLIIVGFTAAGALLLWAASLDIPDLRSFEERKVEQSTKIYDRTGETLLYDLHANIQRTVVPFESMSHHIKNATVAIEDEEFYEHIGVKPTAFLRAVFVNIFALEFEQGGSTITQQVVKNSLLTQEKLISRKIKEWVLAIKLERVLSKEEILEQYLNEVPYGGSIYGIEEASRSFFDKPASELTLAESAYLAALPQAPTYYSPYGNNRDKLEARKNLVLERMRTSGFITTDEYEAAKSASVEFEPRKEVGIKAPHFVFYVREQLEERYGKRALEERGFRVTTTLDWELQQKMEEIVARHAEENEEDFNAKNAAAVAINPKNGQIVGMVGSRDYSEEEFGAYNIITGYPGRQPGSAFKPFVYAAALKKGYTTETTIFDVRTQFSTACAPDNLTSEGECYSPQNYDNTFRGPVTFREALAQSINIPAVKTLYLAGLPESLRLAKDLGITTLTDVNRYGLTLVLGGGEVRPLDITSAYGVFANEGVRNNPTPILRVEDSEGNVIDEFEQQPVEVLDASIARRVSDMLSDNEARTPAFGANSPLHFPGHDVAAKTGTTNDYKDAWIVGYTPTVALGAWAGNNDNTSMAKEVAGFVVAPMWNDIMQILLEKYPQEQFPEPDSDRLDTLKPVLRGEWRGGEDSYVIDTVSGKLATEYTPEETRKEVFSSRAHSILFWLDKDDPRGPKPEDPSNDRQFERWEYGVARWSASADLPQSTERPTEYDDIHIPSNFPKVSILEPNNTQVDGEERVVVSTNINASFPIREVEYYIDGSFIGRSTRAPFSFSFTPTAVGLRNGPHTLRIVATDQFYNRGSATSEFSIN